MAGAPPSPTLLGRLKELNFRPVHVYGLTETYGPHTVCAWHEEWDALPADEQARLAARQGQGYAIFDLVRVVDDEMHDVPRDGETLGEVIMRGNNVMKGYFRQPEATAEAFRGGWFHSGDIAVWHPDGYIELRDRKKDIIISGGENISTIEVEQCVARHPAVLECAVVAVPDDKWGERPKAFVTLKPGQTATEDELIEFCRQHIAALQVPGRRGVRRPAEDLHGQGAEVRPAREGVEGPREADQLDASPRVLDQSPVRSGGAVADAIHETLELAELCDRLGYHRYWLAEHHSTPGLAGSSPEVLIGQVAARTSRIRVGSGGVMLQHYSSLKVAESFRVLETLFPGRIDLGIGRAPGSDQLTARALRENANLEYFPQQISDLQGFLHGTLPAGHVYAPVIAMPTGPTAPEMWLLGSSDQSAAVAAHFGTGFSFAHFINQDGGAEVTRAYRRQFQPSQRLDDAARERRRVRRVRRHGGRSSAAGEEPSALHRAPVHRPRRSLSLDRGGRDVSLHRARAGHPPPRAAAHGGRQPRAGA